MFITNGPSRITWFFVKCLTITQNFANYLHVFLVFAFVYFLGPPQPQTSTKSPLARLSPVDIIRINEYPVQTHYVETKDGFILCAYRIPHGKNNSHIHNKTAVLVVHGIGGSSADYLGMGPNKSLGFLLADAGYDVWLENSRGVHCSKNHKHYNPDLDKEQYWDYSYEDMGHYDHPALIDYILHEKKQSQLFFVCHSQGCTSFAVMASAKPEYNKKIKLAVLMAPVIIWKGVGIHTSPLLGLANLYRPISMYLKFTGQHRLPFTEYIRQTYPILCADSTFEDACKFWLTGSSSSKDDPVLVDQPMLPVIYTNSPSEMSWKQIKHFAQGLLKPDVFGAFDYGTVGNVVRYGQKHPPSYNLSRITAPLALFYAPNDSYITEESRQILKKELGNVVGTYMVPHKNFLHLNFVWANDGKRLVYDEVLKYLNAHELN